MEITKEQKEAIEYLEKYTKWETYGERNLEKDIITVLGLLKETQRKLEIVNDYNYWVQLAVDRGIELENLQNENEELENDNKYLRERESYLEKRREDIINLFQNQQTNTTISISKVKDKIEELNQYYKKEIYPSLYQWRDITITEHYDEMIELLQELLENKE